MRAYGPTAASSIVSVLEIAATPVKMAEKDKIATNVRPAIGDVDETSQGMKERKEAEKNERKRMCGKNGEELEVTREKAGSASISSLFHLIYHTLLSTCE